MSSGMYRKTSIMSIIAILLLVYSHSGFATSGGDGGGDNGGGDGTGIGGGGGNTSIPVTIDGNSSEWSTGTTTTPDSIPYGDSDTIKIGVLEVDREDAIEFATNPQEVVSGHVRELIGFLEEERGIDESTRRIFVASVTQAVIMLRIENPDMSTKEAMQWALIGLNAHAHGVSPR